MRLVARGLVVAGAAFFLSACAAMNTAHFGWPGPGGSRILSVDAKLRNTVIFDRGNGDLRYCSENGPPAMSAGSFSLAGVLGIGAGQRDVQMSQAGSETVASLEHTQTVNLLYRSLYETCVLWASGALEREEFYTLAARTHRSMVAVLAVEQMTGVVRPRSTIISGPAVTAAVSQSEELIKLLQGYKDERVASRTVYDGKLKAYDDAAKVDITTGGESKKACALLSEPPEADAKGPYHTCVKTKAERDQAKADYDKAVNREDSVLAQLAALSRGLGATTVAGETDEGGLDYDEQKISDVKMALIANSVEKIALTAGIDEALIFCVSYLRTAFNARDTTRDTCNRVVEQRSKQDAAIAADIGGAAEVEHDSIWQGQLDADRMAQLDVQIAQYAVFREKFRALLFRTPDDQWSVLWKGFTDNTPVGFDECPSLDDCRKLFEEPGSPFVVRYDRNQAAFDGALVAWENALAP